MQNECGSSDASLGRETAHKIKVRGPTNKMLACRVAHRLNQNWFSSLLQRLVQDEQERLVGLLGLHAFAFDTLRDREAV